MARKSTSSSTTRSSSSNGHPQSPEDAEKVEAKRLIPGTNRVESTDEFDWDSPQYAAQSKSVPYDPSLLPNGSRSLSSIGAQAFCLGFALSFCCISTGWLVKEGRWLWRLPAFFACLSIFHFLEYWTTARFNMPGARSSSFLLNNGMAYNVAHTLAAIEIMVSSFLPSYRTLFVHWYSIAVGIGIVVTGQVVRSLAMAEAGTNFNHTPAKTKKEGHELVTTGVYAWLRHPSYFAFFWWAVGTQVLVGNKICLLGFLFALWNFFKRRIRAEELTLNDFFGDDYGEYRKRTGTGMPFIR